MVWVKVFVRNSYETSAVRKADVAVFFDVYRASTTLLSLVHVGASRILSANDEETCRKYHADGYELISEVFRGGIDNSPSQVLAGNYLGRPVIHKSTNLTTAVFHNRDCGRMLIGAFCNARVVVDYLKKSGAETIDLVAAAHFAKKTEAVEDMAGARLVEAMLNGTFTGTPPMQKELEERFRSKKERQPPMPPHYIRDIEIAAEIDRFPYVIEAKSLSEKLMEIHVL